MVNRFGISYRHCEGPRDGRLCRFAAVLSIRNLLVSLVYWCCCS